jgi:glycosyltransferase involved in cell wall biosynthesis
MNDSGGVLEFVQEGRTGYICDPQDPGQLADRIDELYSHREKCRRLGQAGYREVAHINWDRTIRCLVEE